MTILLGIDGTGPLGNDEYRSQMRNSFVSYICRQSPAPDSLKRYVRGPAADGMDMGWIVDNAVTFIRLNRSGRHQDAPVLLTGYSRGAAGVIAVARRLGALGIPVSAMMLFDAVDRSLLTGTDTIPDNVARVRHARRSPSSWSRRSFSNCGTEPDDAATTEYTESLFFGTHGGVGGVHWRRPPVTAEMRRRFRQAGPLERARILQADSPYINEGFPEQHPTRVTYDQDLQAAREVWGWVLPFLRETGFLR